MKQFKFLMPLAVGVSMTAILFSCNSGEEKKAEEPAQDTTTAKATEPAAPVKPDNIMVVIAKVANYAKWLPDYESHDSVRLASGLHNRMIARGTKDSNMVMVVLKMDDPTKAKEFAASPGLKERMKKGGVSAPTISFLDMQRLDTTVTGTSRVLITHKVKDWDAWLKVFDADKPNRVAAGLTDRAVGYSVGDNHMVTIALAISDMKKAEDMAKSPELKKKMDEAGVEGPPTFFYYTVAKKY
jgi:hypothetical protein